jgi:hypothetical protein
MNLGKILRDNIILVAGIALPLIVMLFFLLALWIPRWLVAPPQHDLLFSGVSWSEKSIYTVNLIVTEEGRLKARYFKQKEGQSPRRRLFIYEHSTQDVREISIPRPLEENTTESETEREISGLAARTISTNRTAPDGYEFRGMQYIRNDFLWMGFGGRRSKLSIRKQGAVVTIPTLSSYPYYNGTEFVGWLVD